MTEERVTVDIDVTWRFRVEATPSQVRRQEEFAGMLLEFVDLMGQPLPAEVLAERVSPEFRPWLSTGILSGTQHGGVTEIKILPVVSKS